jgi:hypothetical protein
MQDLVNLHPKVLDAALGFRSIEWLSPIAADEFAEYWDDDFLTRLRITLGQRPLRSFGRGAGRGGTRSEESREALPSLSRQRRTFLKWLR